MPEYIIKTSFGKFRVTISDDIEINSDTRIISRTGKIITVGGINKCVGIKTSYNSDIAHLLNVKHTGGGCELDGNEISGIKTVNMINLGFIFVKKVMPNIKYIKLEDKSDIPCTLNNGTIVGISLASHQLLFHQKTWYERYFNAKLINPELSKIYNESKINFSKKPKSFDFINNDLNIMLKPLLHESSSWKDFFAKINIMENKCEIIFFWYSRALKEIFQDVSFERQDWIINLSDITNIDYTIVKTKDGGNRTRKQFNSKIYYDFSYDEIVNYKYRPANK